MDGFQGREVDVVLFSCVRAPSADHGGGGGSGGGIGFLADRRRMNVAITRARRSLVILGHVGRLGFDRKWKDLIKYAAGFQRVLRDVSSNSRGVEEGASAGEILCRRIEERIDEGSRGAKNDARSASKGGRTIPGALDEPPKASARAKHADASESVSERVGESGGKGDRSDTVKERKKKIAAGGDGKREKDAVVSAEKSGRSSEPREKRPSEARSASTIERELHTRERYRKEDPVTSKDSGPARPSRYGEEARGEGLDREARASSGAPDKRLRSALDSGSEARVGRGSRRVGDTKVTRGEPTRPRGASSSGSRQNDRDEDHLRPRRVESVRPRASAAGTASSVAGSASRSQKGKEAAGTAAARGGAKADPSRGFLAGLLTSMESNAGVIASGDEYDVRQGLQGGVVSLAARDVRS